MDDKIGSTTGAIFQDSKYVWSSWLLLGWAGFSAEQGNSNSAMCIVAVGWEWTNSIYIWKHLMLTQGKKAGKWGDKKKKKTDVQWCFADALSGGLLQNCLSGVRDFTFSNVKFLVPGSFRISMHQHDPYR